MRNNGRVRDRWVGQMGATDRGTGGETGGRSGWGTRRERWLGQTGQQVGQVGGRGTGERWWVTGRGTGVVWGLG